MEDFVPLLVFVGAGIGLTLALLAVASLLGPRRQGRVKEMPYESGMDPFHDTRRRFDVRFHLVAVAFLIFDVELLFLYPWAVASHNPQGVSIAVQDQWISGRPLVFGGFLFFLALVIAGLVYEWKKGVLQWR